MKPTYTQLEEQIRKLEARPALNIPWLELGCLLISVLFFIGNFQFVLSSWDIITKATQVNDIQLIYPFLIGYALLSCVAISLYAVLKGGFENLKTYDEKDMILGGILGMILGGIWGMILGMILGMIWGVILGGIWGMILGGILGMIWGMILGMILGMTWGMRYS